MFARRLLRVGYALFMLYICSTFARCLLDVSTMFALCRLWFMHASYLLDVCSRFA